MLDEFWVLQLSTIAIPPDGLVAFPGSCSVPGGKHRISGIKDLDVIDGNVDDII